MGTRAKDKKSEYLTEYKTLCLKYGLEITGCGDCGSAWLGELDEEKLNLNELGWRDGYTEIGFHDTYDSKSAKEAEVTGDTYYQRTII